MHAPETELDRRPAGDPWRALAGAIIEQAVVDSLAWGYDARFFASPAFAWLLAESGVNVPPAECAEAVRLRALDATAGRGVCSDLSPDMGGRE